MNMTWALSYTLVSVAAAAIIFTIYRHVTYDMGGKKEIDAFRNFLLSFLGFVLFNGVCIWANHYHLGVLGTIFTTLNLIGISATALFWFYYIATRLSSYYFKNKHLRMLMFVPMTIVILLIASSPLTHLIFYYDEEGKLVATEPYGGSLRVTKQESLTVEDQPLEPGAIEFLGVLTDVYQRLLMTEVLEAYIE